MKMKFDWPLVGHFLVVSAIFAAAFVGSGDLDPSRSFLGESATEIARLGD